MRCAFLTLDDPAGYTMDDHLAVVPLSRRGWTVEEIPWRRYGVEWTSYDAVVIRSTWDYAKDSDAFLATLTQIAACGVALFNPLPLVKWNIRKTYLRDLAGCGISIVPTVWRQRLAPGELRTLLDEVGSGGIVVKPIVGASASGAYRISPGSSDKELTAVERHYAERPLMAQPFAHAIPVEGELSLFYFNGEYSHAIRKRPRVNDFRVQEEHGGSSTPETATAELRALGAGVLGQLGETPLYARVDFVRANDADGYWLMELELIEPSLYLRMDDKAPERFAAALHERTRRP